MYKQSKEFWDKFKATPGALSATEACAIMYIASLAPQGTYICLGAHKGKDTLASSQTLKSGKYLLVEPEFSDAEWVKSVGKLVSTGNPQMDYLLIPDYSYNVIPQHEKYAYLFWDSGEHGGTVLERETEMIKDCMIPGGIVCSHDIGNQFTQQTVAMEKLVATGNFEWINIPWDEIIPYVKENNLEEGNNSWHIYAENPYPNFVGAVKRKV